MNHSPSASQKQSTHNSSPVLCLIPGFNPIMDLDPSNVSACAPETEVENECAPDFPRNSEGNVSPPQLASGSGCVESVPTLNNLSPTSNDDNSSSSRRRDPANNLHDVARRVESCKSTSQPLSGAVRSIFDVEITDHKADTGTESNVECRYRNTVSTNNTNTSPIFFSSILHCDVDSMTDKKLNISKSEQDSGLKSLPQTEQTAFEINSSAQPKGILKKQQPFSTHAKTASNCLTLLSETSSGDKAQMQALICQSASEVFDSLCFDQFFHNGECLSGSCNDIHEYKLHLYAHELTTVWYASLYVICNAALPHLQIVKGLVQYFADKGKKLKALAFAKCIVKMKHLDGLELANFIVDIMSGVIPRRDIVTVILMLTFSEMPLSSSRYNLLMEDVGILQQNTSHYSELINFLNYHAYRMPPKFLKKLMEDALEYGSLATQSIAEFLKRLLPTQLEEVRSTAILFQERFGIRLSQDPVSDCQQGEPRIKNIRLGRVQFSNKPDVREFQPSDDYKLNDYFVANDESTPDEQDVVEDEPNFYTTPSQRIATVLRVFRNTCQCWALKGNCSNSDCSYFHDFDEKSLDGLSSEEVYTAAEFVISKADAPHFKLLKTIIEFLAESNEIARVLQFRKCARKLSESDQVKLTKLMLALLNKHMSAWEAMEKLIVRDLEGNQFYFDKEMLCRMMLLAINEKTSILRSVSLAILHRLRNLSVDDLREITDIHTAFLQKTVRWNLKNAPDIVHLERNLQGRFPSHLKVALYNGASNHFFLAASMLKLAVDTGVQNQALDVLYTFLLSRYDRVQVLTHLLDHCKYFNFETKPAIMNLLGALGLSTSIRLYENENPVGAAELLAVLKKFKFNFFELLPLNGNMTHTDLTTFYCDVTVDTVHRDDAIDVFLNHCVQPYVRSIDDSTSCPSSLVKLTEKMFRVFTSTCSVKQSLKLLNGIRLMQQSFVSPLNIAEYIEPTLRCSFHSTCDGKLRRESLKLFLDVIGSQTPVTFQKVTYRSVFATALMELMSAFQKAHLKGMVNCFHPLLKKIFLKCIDQGIYPRLEPTEITIHSSMVEAEIKVCLLWWFCLFVRARKRRYINFFTAVTVNIVQDCTKDDLHLPVHHNLRMVDVSVSACAARLSSVVKNLVSGPVLPSMLVYRTRTVLEMSPMMVQSLAQVAVNHSLQHQCGYSEVDRMCTFCFDEQDVDLAEL